MPLEQVPDAIDPLPTTTVARSAPSLDTMSDRIADHATAWLERIEAVIERYPWPTLLIALGVGYVISRRMR